MRQFMLSLTCLLTINAISQNVGIGTTTPNSTAQLHIDLGTNTTKGFLVTGAYNSSATVPSLGAGSRLMFYPGKAAFRAGYATGTIGTMRMLEVIPLQWELTLRPAAILLQRWEMLPLQVANIPLH